MQETRYSGCEPAQLSLRVGRTGQNRRLSRALRTRSTGAQEQGDASSLRQTCEGHLAIVGELRTKASDLTGECASGERSRKHAHVRPASTPRIAVIALRTCLRTLLRFRLEQANHRVRLVACRYPGRLRTATRTLFSIRSQPPF